MKIAFFSDLHIKKPGDEACDLYMKFDSNPSVQAATHIIFLGDIFDMLIGEHKGYFKKYDFFFNSVLKFLNEGKEVIYLEGNHDFHIKKKFENFVKKNSKNSSLFRYIKDGEYLTLNDQKYYFCHGDEVDFFNKYFKRWKRIYTSTPFKLFVNTLPFSLIEYLGQQAAKDSKRRGKKTFNLKKAKEKYLVGAKALLETQEDIQGVICGHTHIQENHKFDNGKEYLNCGYPLKNKNFLYFNGTSFDFISLEDS